MTAFDVNAYLARMNYHGPLSVDIDSLRALHLAHMRNVPYENLSIMAGQPLYLDEPALYEKIVVQRRGGFCYELNLSFAHLLRELGFPVGIISARIAKPDGSFGPIFDHIALKVEFPSNGGDERWLVDVGNSRWFDAPLRLDCADYQTRNHIDYRIERLRESYLLYQRDTQSDAAPDILQYIVMMQPCRGDDFKPLCQYKSNSPNSKFTQGRMCSRVTDSGRLTLSERIAPDGISTEWRLITLHAGRRDECPIGSEAEFTALLHSMFGIPETLTERVV